MGDRACIKWWSLRTNLEKTLFSLSLILFVTCVIFLLVGLVKHSSNSSANGACNTQLCIETAGGIISKGNFDGNACEDFYEYACGKYVASHSIAFDGQPVSVAEETADAVLLRAKAWLESKSDNSSGANSKAKMLFRSCMNSDQETEKPVVRLRKAFEKERLGSWPLITDLWIDDTDKLETVMASLISLNIPTVAQMEVVPDSEEGTSIIKLSPGLPFSRKHKDVAVSLYIESALVLLGIPMKLVTSKSDDILTIESSIWQLKNNSDFECIKNDRSNGELGTVRLGNVNDVPGTIRNSRLDWKDILNSVFEILNSSVISTHPLDVYCKRHIREFSDYFYNSSPTLTHNYLGWRFFLSVMPYLSPELRRLHQENQDLFYGADSATSRQAPKWKSCLSLVEKYMLPVIGNFYRNNAVTEDILKEKTVIASSIRSSISETISKSVWLEEEEKMLLQQKVSNSKFELPTSKLLDSGTVNDMFNNLDFVENDLLQNVLKLMKANVRMKMRRILTPKEDYSEWDEGSIVTSDAYFGKDNLLRLGFDKISRPYLCTRKPSSMNYGAFGTHLARLLNIFTKTLDFKGNSNDSVWEVFRWQNKDNCFILAEGNGKNQFADYNTEALIELNSVYASYKAYQKQKNSESQGIGLDFSEDKMFFLSYAQSMCEVQEVSRMSAKRISAKEKVNFALKNFQEFSSAFECPHNAPMNPSEKCQLWD